MPTITREIYSNGELVSTEEIEVPERPLAERLENLFLQALEQLGGLLLPAQRGELFKLKAGVVEALKFDTEAAKALIENADLPDNEQVEAARQALLAAFPEE